MSRPDLRTLTSTAVLVLAAAACAGLGDAGASGLGGGEGEGDGEGDDGGYTPGDASTGAGDAGEGGAAGESSVAVDGLGPATGPTSGGGAGGDVPGGFGGGGGGGEAVTCADHVDAWTTVASVVVDDSNSYASPLLVRELVFDALRDPAAHLPVRPHEFLNYYAEPIAGGLLDLVDGPLRVGADLRLRAKSEGGSLAELFVTVSAKADELELPPDVTLLLDASISMGGEGIDRLEGVVRGATAALASDQAIAVVSSNPADARVRELAPWDGELGPILAAARRLTPDADFGQSLRDALQVARDGAISRGRSGVVLVVSDGSVGVPEDVLVDVSEAREGTHPVRVVGVGVGPARGYADELFDGLTDLSGGAYWYAPDPATAEAEVAARFAELTRVAARDVSLRLHLPDGVSVAALAGGAGQQGDFLAEGQNLGHGGVMPFHVVLHVAGEVAPCTTLGIEVQRRGPDGLELVPATGPVPVRIDEALEPGASSTPALLRAAAIVAAAEALRGERTAARLRRAADELAAVLLGGPTDPEDPLVGLCGQIQTICAETPGASCAACVP